MQLRAAAPDIDTDQLKRMSGRGFVLATRLGYFTHGVIYGLVGVLALLAAFGRSAGHVTDSHGAVRHIGRLSEPMLWAVAIGLACYALWGLVRAVLDPERDGRDAHGIFSRVAHAISGVSHGLLAAYAFRLASGVGSSGGSGSATHSVSEALRVPGGAVIVGIVGVCVAGYGLFEVYRALANHVGRELSGGGLPAARRRLITRIARFGVAARGAVFPVVGVSLVIAAVNTRPSAANSFGEALIDLAAQPFGSVLLALVAAGLVAYGAYQWVLAWYVEVTIPN